jgi:hypothetical protein
MLAHQATSNELERIKKSGLSACKFQSLREKTEIAVTKRERNAFGFDDMTFDTKSNRN